jgi:hypothetical protein
MTDEDKIARARAALVEQRIYIWVEESSRYGVSLSTYATYASMEYAYAEFVKRTWRDVVGDDTPMPDDWDEAREIYSEQCANEAVYHSFDSCIVQP